MALNRWDPFGTPFTESFPLDVGETEDGYVVRAYLPGVSPECADISVHGGMLTIRVQLPENDEPDVRTWLVRERRAGSLERGVRLPTAVDADAAQAGCDSGVLRIVLPKAQSARPRRIPVSGGAEEHPAAVEPAGDVHRDDVVGEASDMSFPASDPPSWTPAKPGGGAEER